MIAVVNVGPVTPAEADNPLGLRRYEVRLCDADGYTVEATFEHRRADGLGRCLLEASRAVERARWSRAAELLEGAAAAPGNSDNSEPPRAREAPAPACR